MPALVLLLPDDAAARLLPPGARGSTSIMPAALSLLAKACTSARVFEAARNAGLLGKPIMWLLPYAHEPGAGEDAATVMSALDEEVQRGGGRGGCGGEAL